MIARIGLGEHLQTRKTMKMLNRFSIKAKLALLLGLSAVSLVAALGIAATVLHQRMIDDRIAMMRAVVDSADGMASALEGDVQQGKLTRDEAIDRLRNIEAVGNAVDKSGVAASEVLAAATELASQSQAMRREVDQFLLTVRAA